VRTILGLGTISRRRFLRRSAAGVLLLGAGALLPTSCSRYPTPDQPLLYLNGMEYAVINLAAAQILGLRADEVGSDGVDVGLFVDRFVADFDRDLRRQVRLALRVFEHGTHVFDLKRVRFTALSAEERERYLYGWMDSSIGARRVVFHALKALAALGYYSQPTTWQAIGYDGPWIGRFDIERRSVSQPLVPWKQVLEPKA
jgi:hypothetical protein